MNYEGHIGVQQGVFLTVSMLTAMLFLQYPQYLIEVGGPAGWQVAVIMTVGAMVLFLPMAALARRFPGAGLAAISEEVAGPVIGPALTLLVGTWLLLAQTLTARNFTETFIASILPNTPPSVLIVGGYLVVAYASYRGLESLSRANQILYPLILIGGFVMLGFSLPRADAALLYPLWGYGATNTLVGGGYYVGMAAEIVVLLVIAHAFRSAKDLTRTGLYSLGLFGLFTVVSVAMLVAVMGAQDAAQSPFPMYQLTRLVYLGRFLQRTESVIVLFWFFASAIRIAILFHAAVLCVGGALRLPFYRPLAFPLAIVSIALSLVPKDFVTVLRLERDWDRMLGLCIMAVPIVLLGLAVVRKKGALTHDAS